MDQNIFASVSNVPSGAYTKFGTAAQNLLQREITSFLKLLAVTSTKVLPDFIINFHPVIYDPSDTPFLDIKYDLIGYYNVINSACSYSACVTTCGSPLFYKAQPLLRYKATDSSQNEAFCDFAFEVRGMSLCIYVFPDDSLRILSEVKYADVVRHKAARTAE